MFFHAGGIDPVLNLLADAPLHDQNALAGSELGGDPPAGAVLALQPPSAHFCRVGTRPLGHHAAGADLRLLRRPARRIGTRLRGRRPHPVLLGRRRDLAWRRVRVGTTSAPTRGSPTSCSTAPRSRPTMSSSCRSDLLRALDREQPGRPRGRGHRDRVRAPGRPAQRGGHHRDLEPSNLTQPAALTASNGHRSPCSRARPGRNWYPTPYRSPRWRRRRLIRPARPPNQGRPEDARRPPDLDRPATVRGASRLLRRPSVSRRGPRHPPAQEVERGDGRVVAGPGRGRPAR